MKCCLPLRDIVALLNHSYCRSIGYEYGHIASAEQRRWIRTRLELPDGHDPFDNEQKKHILNRLSAAEGMERYLHTKYVGQKRFSLEGGESLIPMLDQIIQRGGGDNIKEFVIGMAHRGRLNVLVNTLGKEPSDLFSEFEGKHDINELAASGDVKYHQGFSSDIKTPGGPVHISLAFNPSHLEIVSPVVEGSVRARQERRGDTIGRTVARCTLSLTTKSVLPLAIQKIRALRPIALRSLRWSAHPFFMLMVMIQKPSYSQRKLL